MPSHILEGLSLVDATGRAILGTIAATLLLGLVVNLRVRARYAKLEADLAENGPRDRRFASDVLNDIVRSVREAAAVSREPNAQAIVESHFQSELGSLLLGERFVRAATGLVIILGLMGTFYGLTLSIGKLVALVAGDAGTAGDVAQAMTTGLTQALSGMAVAFTNSLLGIASAVVLTVLGVVSNLTDRRVALMIHLERHLDRVVADPGAAGEAAPSGRTRSDGIERRVGEFGDAVERLDGVVTRFEAALSAFSASTRDFSEFNAHLKDNVQRMSLSFGDLGDALKTQVTALKKNGQ